MKPRSALDQAGNMVYFPRMLDKIRLHGRGELDAAYHQNLGHGADNVCCSFLRVRYPELRARVLAGGTDEEILEWCFAEGRRLNEIDLRIWNGFAAKLGWNDPITPHLVQSKKDLGLENRDDIQTMPQLFDVEEGRKP